VRIIASLLGLVPIMAFVIPTPLGVEEGTTPDISGTYSDCSTLSFLPDVPPASIEIRTSFGGGVNDIVVNPGSGSIIPQVSNTFIADGEVRSMFVQEFGIPVGASRMVQFESMPDGERLVVEQTDDLFGTIVNREITVELFTSGRLDYSVAFGPFIVYSVRCQAEK